MDENHQRNQYNLISSGRHLRIHRLQEKGNILLVSVGRANYG